MLCYLGATIPQDGSRETEMKIRLALATSAMIRLYTICNRKYINFKLKFNLYSSLVLSILTQGCETWTINSVMYKQNPSIRKQIPQETDQDKVSGKKD